MKNWLKIFKGETEATAQEIGSEMGGLRQEKAVLAAKLDEARQELQSVQIEVLGGNKDAATRETELSKQVEDLNIEVLTFERALNGLQEKMMAARDSEKLAEIAGINDEIAALRKEHGDMLLRFLKSAGETAALAKLLTNANQATVGANTFSVHGLSLSANDRAPMTAAFNKAMGNKTPLPVQIETLLQRRADLTGQERHVNWLAWQ